MTKEEMIKAQVYFPASLYETLKQRSKRTGKPVAYEVRALITSSLEKENTGHALLEFSKKFARERQRSFEKDVDKVVYGL